MKCCATEAVVVVRDELVAVCQKLHNMKSKKLFDFMLRCGSKTFFFMDNT